MFPRDVRVSYTSCRDVGRMALVAAKQGPPKDLRYLPVWTDFVSGDEIVRLMKLWHGKDFTYNAPPLFVVRFFAPEVAAMRDYFEDFGRQQHPNLEQMYETRQLLGNDYWTLEKWFIENGFDKKLKPVPPSNWKKVLTGAVVVGATIIAAMALYWNH